MQQKRLCNLRADMERQHIWTCMQSGGFQAPWGRNNSDKTLMVWTTGECCPYIIIRFQLRRYHLQCLNVLFFFSGFSKDFKLDLIELDDVFQKFWGKAETLLYII